MCGYDETQQCSAAVLLSEEESAREVLAQWMGEFGVRQSDMARRIGISSGYFSLIVSGQRVPSGEVAARIERATSGFVMAARWWPGSDRVSDPDSEPPEAAEAAE